MAIKIILHAKDQIVATGIVEFALSSGAFLDEYRLVDGPLMEPEEKSTKRASSYQVVDIEEIPFQEGSKREKAFHHLMRHAQHGQHVQSKEVRKLLSQKLKINTSSAGSIMKALVGAGALRPLYDVEKK